MSIVVFPLNAGPNTRPSLARQLSNFAQELAREATGAEIDFVTLSIQVPEDGNRIAMVNPSETLNEPEIVQGVFGQREDISHAVEGLLAKQEDESYKVTIRCWERGNETPVDQSELTFKPENSFDAMRMLLEFICKSAGKELPADWKTGTAFIGTDDQVAFLKYLEGHDALLYINQAQGNVVSTFLPGPALELLNEALDADADWEAPYVSMVMLCRLCTQYRLGAADVMEGYLQKLVAKEPGDMRGWFALGELYEAMGEHNKASDAFEKCLNATPEDHADRAVLLTKLGVSQMQAGMPANAERSLKKALDLEGPEKPSMGFLADILRASGRQHEIPALWKSIVDAVPENPWPRVQYANSLINDAGSEPEGLRAFDLGLETSENPVIIKRFYAPVLMNIARRERDAEHIAEANDMIDRALDMYEDCLDVEASDVALLMEYVDALMFANRSFEAPKVLRDILQLTDGRDQNIWANAQALLIELEQPKRAEAVEEARIKMEAGDVETGIKHLRPLKNWLADYWKLWAVMAQGLLAVNEDVEAQEASTRLLNLMPSYEPGYNLLVESLIRQSKGEEAYNIMSQVIPNFPQSLNMAVIYARSARHAGRNDEARNVASQIRSAASQNPQMLEALGPVLAEIEA